WAMFRFDLMFGTLGLVLAAAYGYALYMNKQRGLDWSAWRTTWFMLGALSLTVVMSTGIGMYIPALYSMHMLGHMVLSMVIPLFLVLGAPLTLVMQAFEPGQPGTPSLHDWVVAFVHSKTLRYLTHPVVNLLQFLVVFYALYLSFDFYHLAISEHTGHVLMNWAFLVSGYVYFWEVVGPDPLPHRRPTLIRLGVLFASMPIHLFMGVYLMQLTEILGVEYYQQLGLPWNPDLLADQRVGGGVAWGFGQFPLALVFGKLFLDWLRDDRSEAVSHDLKADIDGDDDLAEYNRMLAQLNRGESGNYRQ
ncbi:MAG: cytochrome c oxidase assembly protein, partial [Corynebacterium sp.]|nr:cytochrome c oxidase assembly protein [Corynebacterium sp.]